jgi:hypothetical protein
VVTLQGVTLAPPPGGIRPECPRVSNKFQLFKNPNLSKEKTGKIQRIYNKIKPKKPLSQEEKIQENIM